MLARYTKIHRDLLDLPDLPSNSTWTENSDVTLGPFHPQEILYQMVTCPLAWTRLCWREGLFRIQQLLEDRRSRRRCPPPQWTSRKHPWNLAPHLRRIHSTRKRRLLCRNKPYFPDRLESRQPRPTSTNGLENLPKIPPRLRRSTLPSRLRGRGQHFTDGPPLLKHIYETDAIVRKQLFDFRTDDAERCADLFLTGRAYNLKEGVFASPCVKCHYVFRGLWGWEAPECPVRWCGFHIANCAETIAYTVATETLGGSWCGKSVGDFVCVGGFLFHVGVCFGS